MAAFLRRVQAQLPSIIVSGLALYFAVFFIFGGIKMLLLLYQGAPGYVAESLAQALGYAFGPSFAKVTTVAAAIGAAKLAVGGYFILAVTEGSAATVDGAPQKDYGALDFALHGAVALTMLQVIPAWINGLDAVVRMHSANVLLICVAIGASMFDREHAGRRCAEADVNSAENPAPPW